MYNTHMSERLRFRDPNQPDNISNFNDWLNPHVDAARRVGAAVYSEGSRPVVVPMEIIDGIETIAHGTAKQREIAKKQLVNFAAHGTTVNLLNTTTYALGLLIRTRRADLSPEQSAFIAGLGGPAQLRTSEAVGNVRGFMVDLVKTLSTESRLFQFNARSKTSSARALGASLVMGIYLDNLSEDEVSRLPDSFKQFGDTVKGMADRLLSGNASVRESFYVGYEVTRRDVDELTRISQKPVGEISQADFDLTIKTLTGYHRVPARNARDLVNGLFMLHFHQDGITRMLQYFDGSLNSKDPLIRNSAQILFFMPFRLGMESQERDIETQGAWLTKFQNYLEMYARDPETISAELREQIEEFIPAFIKSGAGKFVDQILVNIQGVSSTALNSGRVKAGINEGLVNSILNAQDNPILDLLARAYKETETQILEEELLDLFDESRSLGYFLENLRSHWQDLRRINREQMWPSFITARQAKLWPSESELDILTFSRRHPAEVLGFSGIRFFTKGFTQPEVGVEFTFKNSDTTLRGRLSKDGHLIDLPFDLEESHTFERPNQGNQIHAFLEHVAIGSFQELVTIAEKRIKEKAREGRIQKTHPGSQPRGEYMPSLPRRETTYVTISGDYPPQNFPSDEVIKGASDREKLPRMIPQRVVPLAYAQRYRFLRDQLAVARREEVSDEVIKTLEGDVLYALSLIPRPSVGKLEKLPEQFQLDRTIDGKFLDTWRVEHIRPKPKEGEEPTLPELFERRFKAAPIALTKHLETWFTQPSTTR